MSTKGATSEASQDSSPVRESLPDTGSASMRVSVVVPVYNSAPTLPELHHRLISVLENCASDFEIVFVDDCGRDNAWNVIVELAICDPRVRGIRHSRNYGQHNALLTGILSARFENIVTIDDDLQNPPEEIPRLLAELFRGFDVVYGTPAKEQHGFLRDRASQITKLALQSAMGAETARNVSAFRAFRTFLRASFADYKSPFVSIDVLLTWGTSNFGVVRVKHVPRSAGVSNYTFGMLTRHALNMLTGFSVVPLQLASMIGFAFTAFGILLLVYVIGRYFIEGSAVPGFPFLASMVAIFSGAQMFALGIIGEYLARIHFRSMGRPPAVVRETVGANRSEVPNSLVGDSPGRFANSSPSLGTTCVD